MQSVFTEAALFMIATHPQGLLIPSAGMTTLKNTLVTWIQPKLDQYGLNKNPRGLNFLYADDTTNKPDFLTDVTKAHWLSWSINRDLGYQGTLRLFDRSRGPQLLSQQLIQASPPCLVLEHTYGSRPTRMAEIGIAIHSGLSHPELADLFGELIVNSGLVVIHDTVDLKSFRGPNQQVLYAAHLMSHYGKWFDQRETVKSPVFDDETENSVLLVLEKS